MVNLKPLLIPRRGDAVGKGIILKLTPPRRNFRGGMAGLSINWLKG